ncbi:SIRT1 [Cordylochernes scorpioides]|uniref:SIRT1 n=1 Tax=Cordylochernes scorpioides TaxID=51811 RepID=A0ABY6KGP2_9ARAC|nr:SIRT1 [Cordylochernes scorpioides]
MQDDDAQSTISDISGLGDISDCDDFELSPATLRHLQKQLGHQDPRQILAELAPSSDLALEQLDENTLWRLLLNMLRSPPRRNRLVAINSLNHVIDLLRVSRKIIVLTGAGVSVSCGIPDFRSPNGIYSRLQKDYPDLPDPQAMFDIHYFHRDPRPFFKFAREIYPGQFKPSLSHKFIKLLEDKGKLLRNYTQNIDTLEHEAGISRVITCHDPHQRAFKKYQSTEDSIFYFVQQIQDSFHHKPTESTIAAFIDLSQAFNRVWKEKLILKLDELGIEGSMLSWISNFLSKRTIQVNFNNIKSKTTRIYQGLPQGSILSTIFFNIYLNDVHTFIKPPAKIALYADNIIIWVSKNNLSDAEQSLNKAMKNLQKGLLKLPAASSANTKWTAPPSKKRSSTRYPYQIGLKLCHKYGVVANCVLQSWEDFTEARQSEALMINPGCVLQEIPYCPQCPEDRGAIIKPDIVFFGESLSQEFHDTMAQDKQQCDLLIVVGSSMKVRPVALLPSCLPPNIPQVLINREPLPHVGFDVELLGDCDVVLSHICASRADCYRVRPQVADMTYRYEGQLRNKQNNSDSSPRPTAALFEEEKDLFKNPEFN